MRVFLDANVLFTAAHNPKGKAVLLITLGAEGLFQLATSATPGKKRGATSNARLLLLTRVRSSAEQNSACGRQSSYPLSS